jgi:hypothetical protein
LFHPLILPADEGSYFRLTYQWLVEQMPLYTGTFDHKPPGVYYLYGLFMTLGGPSVLPIRIGVIVFSWIGAMLAYGFTKRLAVQHPHTSGLAAALTYAVLSCRLTGYNANLEVLFNPLVLATLWLIYEASLERSYRFLLMSGLLAGAVFVIKYTCGATVAALPILWWAWQRSGGTVKGLFSKPVITGVLLFGVAFLVPIALTCLHLYLDGPGVQYVIERTIIRNMAHKEGASGLYKPLAYLYFFGRILGEFALAWLALCLYTYSWRTWGVSQAVLLLGWVATALVSVSFTGHLFDHYLIECLPPLCLMVGLLFGRFLGAQSQPAWVATGLLALVFTPLVADEAKQTWPNLPAYLVAARKGHHIWAGDTNYQIAQYLKKELPPGAYFFAVEGNPTMYVLSGHDVPSSFTYWPMLVRPHFAKVSGLNQPAEVQRLLNLPPTLILAKEQDIAGLAIPNVFPQPIANTIAAEVQKNYVLQDTVAGWWVWKRVDKK